MTKTLKKIGAKDTKIFVLMNKYECRIEAAKDLYLDFCGYEVENWWVVGYGIDYSEKFRGL